MFGSCSTDLDVWDEQATMPVVYALINPLDTVHYVRVQRSFIIRKKEDWQKLPPDSLYFNDVEVFLYGRKNGENMWVRQFQESIEPKEDGFFPTAGHRAFRLDSLLPIYYRDGKFPDIDSLMLEVWIRDMDLVVSSSAKVMRAGQLSGLPRIISLYRDTPAMVSMDGGTDTECDYGGPNSCYLEIEFWVHIKEHSKNTSVPQTIHWKTFNGWEYQVYKIYPARIFSRLRMLLPKSDSVLVRTLDSIDIAITIPSRAFHDFWVIRDYWDQADVILKNFDHAFGLFSTLRSAKKTGFFFDRQTMDSLCNGYWFKEMKFRYWGQ
jgi:hypothetical protein